ncbi:MAG: insulinase family protein, partial [Spirochaetaceae bacterium]|nr:insulinase family protein [Spirochaetaceae bacterium]
MINIVSPNKKKYGILCGLAFALAGGIISCASSARAESARYGGLGKPSDPVPFLANARTGTLPNGLRYYILENRKPENRAYLTLAVNAGSVLETDEEQGLAHFVEHMAFNGTERFPEAELIEYLRSLGMRFGPEVNAYTGYDETVYGIEVPVEEDDAGLKRIPDTALAVIDDWTRAITFDPKDVDDERRVIMEEYRSRLGAMDRVRRQMLPVLFAGSPYAERRPIGQPEVIENAPASTLESFYKKWYRPENMAVILVGDFDGTALEASLPSHFSRVPASAPENGASAPFTRPIYDLPAPRKGVKVEIFTDSELPFTGIQLYYKRSLQPRGSDLAAYREGVIDYLIDLMLSLRFDGAAANPEAPYVGAGGGNSRYGFSSRYYAFWGQAKAGGAEETLKAILREKETMSRYGFTQGELDRAKRAFESTLIRLVSEQDRQESNYYVRDFTEHFLKGTIVTDIGWELDAAEKLLPGISVKDIAGAAKDYFVSEDLTVFVMAPDGEESSLPAKARIAALIEEARKAKLPRPSEEAVTDRLLDTAPAPGAILEESEDPRTGAILWRLENGAQVVLKETANKNNEIVLYALARGGSASAPAAEEKSARLAAEMLAVSGVGPYSLQELQKKLMGRQVAISFWTSSFLRGFQGSATGGDIRTFFELLHLYFTEPRIHNDAVRAMLDQYRTTIAQSKEDPEDFFSREIRRTMYGNHPGFMPLELEDIDKVRGEDAMRFIHRCLNPADYVFVFTGNLSLAADFRSAVETYLASIPSKRADGPLNPFNTWAAPQVVRPGAVDRSVYKGKEARSAVYLGRYAPATYSEETAAAAAALQEYLDIRLTQEIREKRGGVYSIGPSVSLSPFLPPGELSMTIYFECDPKRVEELCAAVEEEVRAAAERGLDRGIFDKAVAALKKEWETSVESNRTIAQSFANSLVIYEAPLNRLFL